METRSLNVCHRHYTITTSTSPINNSTNNVIYHIKAGNLWSDQPVVFILCPDRGVQQWLQHIDTWLTGVGDCEAVGRLDVVHVRHQVERGFRGIWTGVVQEDGQTKGCVLLISVSDEQTAWTEERRTSEERMDAVSSTCLIFLQQVNYGRLAERHETREGKDLRQSHHYQTLENNNL